MPRGIVLSLVQFDFSCSSAIITLNLAFTLGLSTSRSFIKPISDVIFHKTTPSTFFPLSLQQEVTHFWAYIIFNECCNMFVLMTYVLRNIGQQLINLTSGFFNTFPVMFFKNAPAKWDEMFKRPKRDSGYMKVGTLSDERIYFHRNVF